MLCDVKSPYIQKQAIQGSLPADDRADNLMTISGTARCNELDVDAYIEDVLCRALTDATN